MGDLPADADAAAPPPAPVLEAFGLETFGLEASGLGDNGRPQPLAGGEGLSYLHGGAVLKRVHDVEEAAWTQELLSRIDPDGFAVPPPVATSDGEWVHDGWSASRFLPGLRPAAPAWDAIAEAGLRFGAAAERARRGGEELLDRRTHRWAVADRVAWDGELVELADAAAEVHARLAALTVHTTGAAPGERHFVHGDLSGNVHLDPDGVPVILDVSPYLRPRRWAAAIVVADAVLWHGADLSRAVDFAATPDGRDLLGRALVFRMVAEQLAVDPRHRATLDPYRRVLAALT